MTLFSTDVLLNIPTESVAVRAIVASVAGLVMVRWLLQATVRLPRLRAAAVLVPTAALLGVVAVSWGQIDLPWVMVSSDAENALAVPFGNDYLRVAPISWPAVLAVWAVIAGCGVSLRLRRVRRTRAQAYELFTLRSTPPSRLVAVVEDIASRLKVPPPPVAVGDDVCGGASVVGIRRPMLLVDRMLLASMDDEELEGLVAHELAHVRRRDNLLAMLAGLCRDLAFFVPGGRWVVHQLHHEREAAADALAVEITGRPGALASGLLKAIESRTPTPSGAAALAPSNTLESRVRRLCVDGADTSRARRAFEGSAIAGALAASVSLALGIPAWVAGGGESPREVLALLLSRQAPQTTPAPTTEPTAFTVYRDMGLRPAVADDGRRSTPLDDGRELNPNLLRRDPIDGRSPAERVGWSVGQRSLGLRPTPPLTIDAELVADWRATSVLQVDEGIGLYWLSRGPRP